LQFLHGKFEFLGFFTRMCILPNDAMNTTSDRCPGLLPHFTLFLCCFSLDDEINERWSNCASKATFHVLDWRRRSFAACTFRV